MTFDERVVVHRVARRDSRYLPDEQQDRFYQSFFFFFVIVKFEDKRFKSLACMMGFATSAEIHDILPSWVFLLFLLQIVVQIIEYLKTVFTF